MSSFAELLIEQCSTFAQFRRIVPNYRKVGKDKFSVSKTRSRITGLKDLWSQSRSLDISLQKTANEAQRKDEYFRTGEFLVAEADYEEALDYLTDILDTVEKVSEPSEAALLVEHVTVSDANYEGAWKILEEEYNNPHALIFSHIHAFANLPAMKFENASELKRLRDTVISSLAALKNLSRPVEYWDDLLVYMLSEKLSTRTRVEWNLKLGASQEIPTFQELKDFLMERIRGISSCKTSEQGKLKGQGKANVHNTTSRQCVCCNKDHWLAYCPVLRKKSLDERYQIARKERVCFNCLHSGHFPIKCPNEKRCEKCNKPHHTLLHRDFSASSAPAVTSSVERDASIPSTSSDGPTTFTLTVSTKWLQGTSFKCAKQDSQSMLALQKNSAHSNVLLVTAWVRLHTKENREIKARALLDQGSSHTFITESLAQRLRTPRHRSNLGINVFGSEFTGHATSCVNVSLQSCHDNGPRLPFVAYVYQKITSYTATKARYSGTWPHLKGLALADPEPHSSEPISVLIGADIYGHLLLGPIKKGPLGSPTAQLTTLGWIISGPTSAYQSKVSSQASLHCLATPSIDIMLQRFWEIEEVPSQKFLTPEEEECEKHFVRTHSRDSNGRYIVRLPFRNGIPPNLGESHEIALTRYSAIERRLAKKPDVEQEYNAFLRECEAMGHMERAQEFQGNYKPLYMPHHPVIRDSSTTTRLRVVFNTSSATSNGTSLNHYLLTGPKLQQDIAMILLNWRHYQFVCLADIAKMFRQIRIHPDDADYQRIVWRKKEQDSVNAYRLLTVTYGTACAPYLANRVFLQLAIDEGKYFKRAVDFVRNSTYVDDVLFGADSLDETRKIRDEVNELLQRGGFQLRKWASNEIALLQDLHDKEHKLAINIADYSDEKMKVLGINWNPNVDAFTFQVEEVSSSSVTKRSILSHIARLFDPLGWASPVIITAKILMQDLWLQKTDWDQPVSLKVKEVWQRYYYNLPKLSKLRIPRWIRTCENSAIELHGFADASTRAYAAVVFVRVLHSPSDITVQILATKTKVAPIKTVSIPQLESSAIVLLAGLLEYVRNSLRYETIPVYGWTDSTVALAWLSQHPSRWKPYVANRVSEVQTKLPKLKWRHVPTRDNPADCASRGISVDELIEHPLWWVGPQWLKKNSVFWPNSTSEVAGEDNDQRGLVESEERSRANVHAAPSSEEDEDFSDRFSSWGKLLRVTARIKCAIRRFRVRKNEKVSRNEMILATDIQEAREYWIRKIQFTSFMAEIEAIKKSVPLPRASPLKTLNPFLDRRDQLRLGGRLRHSFLSYDERFPIILPRHHVSDLIVDQAHLRTLHGGTQLTIRIIRQNYWIRGARSLVKNRISRCLRCVRERAVSASQLMGDLPAQRVNPSPPFAHSGVDYAGPFQVIPYVGRGQKARKYYVAIFVCLVTRAIHLENVDDYATAGFLAAFRRFVGRRGLPSDVYSDNGTNFQGADHELRRAFIASVKESAVREKFSVEGVKWHFIPAAAPHFGGLWEAGVKSFKHHLKRVVGAHTLSQLELATLLCQIEGALNSRPMTALRDDPESFESLTPGHFLIGRPLLSIPEPTLIDVKESHLSRWQRIQLMYEQIWGAWSKDYLHTLQQRRKWQKQSPSIKKGDLVLLKNYLLPPARWELARIAETYPGPDGLVRVVSVRTAKAVLKRPISKVCPLPVATSANDT